MTTSVKAFAQGKILQSFYIQPAAALGCVVLTISALLAVFVAVFGIYSNVISRFLTGIKIKYIVLALIVIVAIGWAVTLTRALMANNHG
jgi:purine-cytosine permease-like protein